MALLPGEAYYALVEIFVFLAVAELLHSAARRANVPTIVTDILVGVVLSGFALGGLLNTLVGVPIFVVNSYVLIFADFSVILLLFAAGLGGGFTGLREAGPLAVLAAIAGDVAPFAVVAGVFSRVYSLDTALLLGAAAAATSSAVVASVLLSEQVDGTPGGRFLMNIAALDDVVALVLLSVVLTIVGGRVDVIAITGSVFELVIAWVVLLFASVFVIPRILRIPGIRDAQGMPFLILFVLVAIVVALGFSAIIGAYIAGLAVAESLVASRTRGTTEVLLLLFGSLFFVVTGAQFDWRELLEPSLVVLAVVLAALAAAAKLLAVYPFARARLGPGEAPLAVATGMVPRGEIGLIVGSIGFALGLFSQAVLGEVLLMAVLTTLIGAVLFRRSAPALRAASAAAAPVTR